MSKKVKVGNIYIGGGEKITVQSMATCRIKDLKNAVEATKELEEAGCDIVRFSVLDEADAVAVKELKKEINIPIVADIHFDYKLALKAVESGADKIRINPGNVGGEKRIEEIARALKSHGTPVRVGANTGSVEKEFLSKYGKNEESLGESALKSVSLLEKFGVENIVVSVKASDVPLMIKAYEYVAKRTEYPLHLGVTEAGTAYNGIIKNSIGIGALLAKGIGDTVRVSLSAPPVEEVKAAKAILSSLDLCDDCVKLVACPTCGRCEWDCMAFASEVESYLSGVKKPLKVAVMGCAVNGPGEAADADLGVAGAKDGCVIFVKGKVVKKVAKEKIKEEFFKEIDECIR